MASLKRSKVAYLLVVSGRREARKKEALQKILSDRQVELAFLGSSRPGLREAIEACVKGGAQEVVLLALNLVSNRRAKEEIPNAVREAKRRFPAVDFHYFFELEKPVFP